MLKRFHVNVLFCQYKTPLSLVYLKVNAMELKTNIIRPVNGSAITLRNNNAQEPIKTDETLLANIPQHYIRAATSNNTRNAYQADIRHFIAWGGLLPTSSDTVVHYLHQYAETLNPRTLMRRLTALKNWHQYQGFADPTAHSVVRKTLTGIKNIHGKPKNKARALTLDALMQMVAFLKNSDRLIDCRNCALLQIGFFGAFRRSELVAITWETVHFVKEGVEIMILRSKTDQAGEGHVCAIPYGYGTLCPVNALMAWRDRSHCSSGPVFSSITGDKVNQIGNESIQPRQVNVIIKTIAQACCLPESERYSGHSLRHGFATEASKNNVPFAAIKRQGRWLSDGSVFGYINEGKRFDQNAAGIMLNERRDHNDKSEQSKTPTDLT